LPPTRPRDSPPSSTKINATRFKVRPNFIYCPILAVSFSLLFGSREHGHGTNIDIGLLIVSALFRLLIASFLWLLSWLRLNW